MSDYTPPHLRTEAEKDKLMFGKKIGKFVTTGEVPKPRKVSAIKEVNIHNQVCKYLKAQYPHIMFISDFAAGIKMSKGMATRQANQKSNHSFPDLMILEPRNGYHGLLIELKRDRDSLYNKNGLIKSSQHLDSQAECILLLNKNGYYSRFACGFDEAKQIIDWYLR